MELKPEPIMVEENKCVQKFNIMNWVNMYVRIVFINFLKVKEKQLKQNEKNNNEERVHTCHGIQAYTYWNKVHFKKDI